MAHSIAIMTDSAHLATDMLGFAISMMALKLGASGSTEHYSFGWHRAEVVGTLVSVSVIWIITIVLVWKAGQRLF
jgi:zinc transporter 2